MPFAFNNMRLDKKYMQISAKATIPYAAYTQYALMSKENDEDSSNNKSPNVVFLSFFYHVWPWTGAKMQARQN